MKKIDLINPKDTTCEIDLDIIHNDLLVEFLTAFSKFQNDNYSNKSLFMYNFSSRNNYLTGYYDDIIRLIATIKYLNSTSSEVFVNCYNYQMNFIKKYVKNTDVTYSNIHNISKIRVFSNNLYILFKKFILSLLISRKEISFDYCNFFDSVFYKNSNLINFNDRHFSFPKNKSSGTLLRVYSCTLTQLLSINFSKKDDSIFFDSQFLTLKEKFSCLFDSLKLSKLIFKEIKIEEFDLSLLFGTYFSRVNFSISNFDMLMRLLVLKKIYNKNKKFTYLSWYENQQHELMINSFLNNKKIRNYAYFGFHSSNSSTNLLPTIYEIKNNLIPKKICCINESFFNILPYHKLINIKKVTAYRYAHIEKWLYPDNVKCINSDTKKSYLFVPLPINSPECLSIIDIIIKIDFIDVKVKPHPACSNVIMDILKKSIKLNKNISISDGEITDSIKNSIAVFSSASSVLVESILLSKNTMMLYTNFTISQDVLNNGLIKKVSDHIDIRNNLKNTKSNFILNIKLRGPGLSEFL